MDKRIEINDAVRMKRRPYFQGKVVAIQEGLFGRNATGGGVPSAAGGSSPKGGHPAA